MTANVKNYHAAQAGNFSFTSTSYINALDNAGGSAIQRTITKGASSDILVLATVYGAATVNVNPTITLGVNDGTTDYDLGRTRWEGTALSSPPGMLPGLRLITGLGAGTYTFTLRIKNSVAFAAAILSGTFVSFTVIEVNTGTQINCAAMTHLYTAAWTTVGTGYNTVTTQTVAGTTIRAALTKAGAGTNVLVRGFFTGAGTGVAILGTLGILNSATDYDAMTTLLRSGQAHSPALGERLITGLAAGAQNFDLRAKCTASAWNASANIHSAGIVALEVG